ncbi:MAG: copper chaperone PCu(A)C, partial [Burkholderiales bacterium]
SDSSSMKKNLLKFVCATLWCWAATTVFAADEVKVSAAWVRTTAPGQRVAGAYLQITSNVPAKLIAASSPLAGNVEIHSMSMNNGVMQMRQLDILDLPGNKTVTLEPGGLHLMLLDLKKPLTDGDKVPLRLILQRAGGDKKIIEVQATVRNTAP